jgi:hypothetical protein
MKSKLFLFAVILVLATILLSGCGAGAYAITRAELRDWIFNVEPRNNGSMTVWMRHDDVGAYCTLNSDLQEKINGIWNSPDVYVYLTYRSVNNNDAEYNWTGTGDGCAADRATTRYKILGIERVADRFPEQAITNP